MCFLHIVEGGDGGGNVWKLADRIYLNQDLYVPVLRLYFCDQYYQLSDVLLANWSWVIENGISIFPIAGSFHHYTSEPRINCKLNLWNHSGLLNGVIFMHTQILICFFETRSHGPTHKIRYSSCKLCLARAQVLHSRCNMVKTIMNSTWEKPHWSRRDIHDHEWYFSGGWRSGKKLGNFAV